MHEQTAQKIKRYRITFYGRTVGAIGIDYEITAEREGVDMEAARLALYDKYEHVHVVRYEEVGRDV